MRKRLLVAVSLVFVGLGCSSEADPAAPPSGTGGAGGRGSGGSPASGSGGLSGGQTGGTGGGSPGSGGVPGSGGTGTGGTGGTAGQGDAAASDATSTADGAGNDGAPGASSPGCAGAKNCFDFEDQTVGQAPTGAFKVQLARGTVLTDETRHFSGKKSVLIKTPSGTNFPGNNLVFSGLEASLPDNDLHGRVMVWMSQTPGAAHWDSIMGSSAGGANPTYIVGGMYRKFMSVYHPGDCSVDSSTDFPTGRWACIQWQFKGAKDGTHVHKMMLDGQMVNNGLQDGRQGVCAAGGGSRDWKAPTFSELKIGYRHFGSSVAVDMWIDDLAFGDQPIPCPTAQ
jgi:hypothetical protein